MPTQFKRSDFYNLVWSKPISHLAGDLGVSDVALHKVCKKHGIPKPPQGWWIRKKAGKAQERTPLPDLAEGQSETIVLSSSPISSESEKIAKAREEAEQIASSFDPCSSQDQDPILAKTFAKLRKAKSDEQGLVSVAGAGLIECRIAPASIDRIELALKRIVEAAHAQGFKLEKNDECAVFTDSQTVLPIRVKETYSRTKHDPTPAEFAKEEMDRKDRERRWKRNGWGPAPVSRFTRHWAEWDYTPTGKVTFEFDIFVRSASSIRRSFKDGKIQRLENMASEIGIAMAVLAEAKREDQISQEQERKRAADFEERRAAALRRNHVHNRRLEGLERVAARFEKRDRLKTFIELLSEERTASFPPRTAKFKEWLEKELEEAELAVTVDGLEELFESEALFASDEEQGFHPPHRGW